MKHYFQENMVFHILLLLCLSLSSIAAVSSSLISDFHALMSLKQGFTNPSPEIATWDPSNPATVCSWRGIKCTRGRVTSLDLSNMALYGTVSPEISRLETLVNLSIDGNNFTGEIRLENMASLSYVNVSNNQFGGGLDWNYSSLASLEVIDAYNNNFSANLLPLDVLSSKNLKHLELGGNYFYGQIPESYGELATLEYLSLSGNDLTGKIPKELGNLTNLKELYLGYYNVFEGGIPRELGRLVNLVHLDLSSCELDGEIPQELGNLESLDTLYLHVNRISGTVPKELGNLTSLENLDLSFNSLTGEIPAEFTSLKKMKLMNLFMNRLHGSIPDFVSDYPELETLALWMNNFTGIIPRNLGLKQKLQHLDLSSNKLTGTIPGNLCSSNQLSTLILHVNFLFGSIPEDLGSCMSLVRVRLGQNFLNGSIPSSFIYLPELNFLELQSNMLSGFLPENSNSSSNQTKLGQMNLSNNRISGPLPSSLSGFTSLQILLLGGNNFSGPIPPSMGELRQLVKLDLSGNSLTGEIPSQIGNWVHSNYLDLSHNDLIGSIPGEISRIRILNYLNLSRNHLNGSVPLTIGSMKSLTTADFSYNDLSGKLPDSGQFLVFNASSFSGNPQLCGTLLENPCNDKLDTKEPEKTHNSFKLIFALGLLTCSLVFAAAAIIKAKSFKRRSGSRTWKMTSFQSLGFTVSDIIECVKDGNVIGRGGAGIVYYAKMPNGIEIAVKKLLGFNGISSHDHGFKAEIQTLGNIRHRNIVRLLAFCTNKDTNLLVYEYMRNGSMGESLHGKKGGFLSWKMRYKIASDSAKGLCYLHHDCSPLILHRDVKSNNILLNSSFEAHVADFGLAKFLVDGGASQCMSAVAGSYGYIAPEYAYTLRVDEKSDVYSYGVVLLELITGRKPVGEFGEGVDIVQWAKCSTKCRREEVTLILDPRLAVVPKEEAMHLFFIAMLCVQENSVERPTMREVVQMLSEFPRRPSPDHQTPSSSSNNHQPEVTKKKDLLV